MWRLGLIWVLTFFAVFQGTGCLATDQEVNRNVNVKIQENADLPSGGDLIEIDSYEAVDTSLGDLLADISQKLELAPLSKAAHLEGEFEFRIWTNLAALNDPKVLGIRSSETRRSAYFFYMDSNANSIKDDGEHLAGPKSGWDRMLVELRNRLTTPKGLVRDPQFQLSRDEPVILLEVLDKGEYRRVFYEKNTSFPDRKRLGEVCDYLASEFDVNMDCHGDPAAH